MAIAGPKTLIGGPGDDTVRAALKVGFTRSQYNGYYGIGNASFDMSRMPGVDSTTFPRPSATTK